MSSGDGRLKLETKLFHLFYLFRVFSLTQIIATGMHSYLNRGLNYSHSLICCFFLSSSLCLQLIRLPLFTMAESCTHHRKLTPPFCSGIISDHPIELVSQACLCETKKTHQVTSFYSYLFTTQVRLRL